MPRPTPHAGAPGPFRLAPLAEFENVLRQAGFSDIETRSVEVVFEVDSTDLHWQIVNDMSAPIEQAVATLPAAEAQRLKQAMAEAIEPYRDGRRIRLPNYGTVHFRARLICSPRMRITVAHHIPASCQRWRESLARELPEAEVDVWGTGRAG